MNEVIAVFVDDLKLGTKISSEIASLNMEAVFPKSFTGKSLDDYDKIDLVIVDFEDRYDYGETVVESLKHIRNDTPIVALFTRVKKESHDRLKEVGCDMILPRLSFVRNISSITQKFFNPN